MDAGKVKVRRWSILDAIVLIAATAVATVPATVLAPEVIPIIRMFKISRVFEKLYVESLFHGHMQSGRGDSVAIQAGRMLDPIIGARTSRRTYLDRRTGREATAEVVLENWIKTHSRGRGGALGYALAQDGYFLAFPFLILWSLGLLVLRLVPPRPGWADLFRQPGWWASLPPVVVFPLAVALEHHEGYGISSLVVPVSVAFAWAGLGLMRLWQSEPTWIDRAGRFLGVLWLGTIPVYLVGYVFSHR